MTNRMNARTVVLATLLGWGCGLADTGPAGTVAVDFKLAQPLSMAAGVADPTARAPSAAASSQSLVVQGDNGTLTIDDIRLVVGEFELERADSACPDSSAQAEGDGEGDEGECEGEEIESAAHFVTVPLDGSAAGVIQEQVPAGTYRELDFESKAPRANAALLAEIRQQIPDWPAEASLLVTGTFTPTGGSPVPFRVFFAAEVEVELEFNPPLVVEAGGVQSVAVTLDPARWFQREGGMVADLSQLDFAKTGKVVRLEAEFEDGFGEIESEH